MNVAFHGYLKDWRNYNMGKINFKVARVVNRISDCLSDCFDNEEHKENVENELYEEFLKLNDDSTIKQVMLMFCECLEYFENNKAGRPIEHEIDFEKVQQMKADGKTNKEIYTELGISKSLFYLKMREYKNNQ